MSDRTDSQTTQGGGTGKKPLNLAVEAHPEPETTEMGSGADRSDTFQPTLMGGNHNKKRRTTHGQPEVYEDDLC